MRSAQFIKRSLTYYWRINLAVLFGVTTAVAVLAGALLVGDSVRGSLRDLFLQRLGNTDEVVSANEFFREQLALDLQNDRQFAVNGFAAACPLIALDGSVSQQSSGRRADSVRVYGIDNRFWQFHGLTGKHVPENRELLLSDSLARELMSNPGDPIVLRIEKPSAIPIESLHGRKEDLGRTFRLTMREALDASSLGEFSVQPQQASVRAVFVSLTLLQTELGQEERVNTILISRREKAQAAHRSDEAIMPTALLGEIISRVTTLDDYGLKLRALDSQHTLSLERDSTLIDDALANTASEVAKERKLRPTALFSYLANRISSGGRSIPYSLVTALDDNSLAKLGNNKAAPPYDKAAIILNEWAARDLAVKEGDTISLEYYVWQAGGQLGTRTAQFRLAAVTPINGLAADRDLVPDYPGISESASLSEWDPPFPVDLKRIRKQDEAYWQQYRTTPKAFISLAQGQELWQSRFGKLTSIRISGDSGAALEQVAAEYRQRLMAALNPDQHFGFFDARAEGIRASQGATDFGEYFLYFSFFLVVAALLLAALFFKLGIEQRAREIGTLQAMGFSTAKIRTLFVGEGLLVAASGSLLGLIGAVAYGHLILLGLRTWWIDAVGTKLLTLHVSTLSLIVGGLGGVLAALLCIVWTLGRLGRASARSLLTGTATLGDFGNLREIRWGRLRPGNRSTKSHEMSEESENPLILIRVISWIVSGLRLTSGWAAIVLALVAILLLAAASLRLIGQVAGFFGGGALFLVALLCYQVAWLNRSGRKTIQGTGWLSVSRLGFRNATYRPGRSVLCIALIAFATFIIVSVDAFRRSDRNLASDRKSGSGGYPLMAESLLPLVHDPNSDTGREALNLAGDTGVASLAPVTFTAFRLRPGDDASCLNLYQPRNPRILAVNSDFIKSNRFSFQNSLAHTKEESENPWLLLDRQLEHDVIPVIADANSLTYILHLKPGEQLFVDGEQGRMSLRVVGALNDSVFQSELLMSEKNFLRLFPSQQGFRFFLIDAPERDVGTVTATLEDRLADFGFDVVLTNERLASFHRVENTYLSTFQMLGGLGLLLGTLGMAAVLLRNVFERRKELALLRAVGYNSSHLTLMVVAENVLLLCCGLATGTVCALLAIAPAFLARGGRLPHVSLGFLLLAVLVSGLSASLVATWAALKSPLLPALKAE